MQPPRSILITGASSGLGRALALHYAGPDILLALTGRNRERLTQTAAACEAKGATVTTACLDVTAQNALASWIESVDKATPLDLVIANAGISAGTGFGGESAEQARQIFAVNVGGVLNTILPALGVMRGRKKGQIAIISSLAGLRGLPSSPAYSASKGAVRVYGEGLRGEWVKYGIAVNVVCPGFIKTPMTDVNPYSMPFMMSAEEAARRITRGLANNAPRIAFPKRLYIPLWLVACLPHRLTDCFFARLPGKPAQF